MCGKIHSLKVKEGCGGVGGSAVADTPRLPGAFCSTPALGRVKKGRGAENSSRTALHTTFPTHRKRGTYSEHAIFPSSNIPGCARGSLPTNSHPQKRYSEIVLSPTTSACLHVGFTMFWGSSPHKPCPRSVLHRLLPPPPISFCTEDWTQACTCQGSYTLVRA